MRWPGPQIAQVLILEVFTYDTSCLDRERDARIRLEGPRLGWAALCFNWVDCVIIYLGVRGSLVL